MFTDDLQPVMARVAKQLARVYHRRHPIVPPEDFAQEAHLAMHAARGSYDPSKAEPGAFFYRVALIACKRLAWKQGAIANGGTCQQKATEVSRQRLGAVDDAALAEVATQEVSPDQAAEQAERRAHLARVVARHLATDDEGVALLAILTGELTSAQAAQAYDVPVSRLYWRTQETKKALRADKRLLEVV